MYACQHRPGRNTLFQAGKDIGLFGGVGRPGGAPGLQNQRGAQQSPRWVRFPYTSATGNPPKRADVSSASLMAGRNGLLVAADVAPWLRCNRDGRNQCVEREPMKTPRKISKQRRWQIRHRQQGLCTLCSEPAVTSTYCLKHAIRVRERKRKELGCKKRIRSLTYRLADAQKPGARIGRRKELSPT